MQYKAVSGIENRFAFNCKSFKTIAVVRGQCVICGKGCWTSRGLNILSTLLIFVCLSKLIVVMDSEIPLKVKISYNGLHYMGLCYVEYNHHSIFFESGKLCLTPPLMSSALKAASSALYTALLVCEMQTVIQAPRKSAGRHGVLRQQNWAGGLYR